MQIDIWRGGGAVVEEMGLAGPTALVLMLMG